MSASLLFESRGTPRSTTPPVVRLATVHAEAVHA